MGTLSACTATSSAPAAHLSYVADVCVPLYLLKHYHAFDMFSVLLPFASARHELTLT